ncbi:retrovirus-related Pol polyprotein from transposon 17.6 [Trichonephila clavipes]|nr:retrovirus-related Pol polyprotein from transposon 17.6 [Trichonephila clavipes]
MSKEDLVDHILVRLEPQVQYYMEFRNPQNTIQLLEELSKFEERYSCKTIRGSRNSDTVKRRGDRRNRGSSENFSRVARRQRGRLNVLKVRDDQNEQTQSANEVLIKLSAICMSPVEHPYVPILLNDTFTKALWDTDKPGHTHVLYHEIDTEDEPSVVSLPYRYDRVKQAKFDYHVEKMLKDGTITPIQSPYVSPVVVLRRKNNGLPPDNPEAYRFAVDYRKLKTQKKLLVNRDVESIRRSQGGHYKSSSFKIAGFQKPFELSTDTSSIGVGAVLNQEQRLVVFASRTLSIAERNDTVTERECLAVVWALYKFRTHLGSLPIKVITNHAALTRLTHGKICRVE